ncbi:SGNH/GDSL hydrolase family protein [Anabaena sp. UHCC 0187]|uniref:SGNH/GDSL hydrolase family protein n=1 Tax=Anabaena sp. UHCC 0187 TaxID=2590018 RepID=UPI001447A9E1|nr:SGNH/GDSL hydrolase family protein [Anabaena sp. UHCC 0187]MDP5016645.1 SGNH/GDSL hydrolase family protein [Dolichospermum sp.]MTJ13579.1 SGNH/GDSL hydrolase family protein [Anabaena sp. UHCC 0187]
MKKQLLTAGFVLLSFMLPVKASAANFTQIYAFGDSLVDNGNVLAAATAADVPFPPYYYQGRFSNGPVWTEYLAQDMGVQLNNLAFGGATTGTNNTISPAFPGLTQEIQGFVATNPSVDNQALYIISAGANDYLNVTDFSQAINNAVSNLANAIISLSAVGAKNFLIANLPNLGGIPANNQTSIVNDLNFLTGIHNSALSQTVNGLSQLQPNLNIKVFDVNSLVSQIIASPGKFGFTNVTDACLNIVAQTICSNPNEYLFWDDLHPTSYAHSIVARSAQATIPEPSTTLSLLGIAALSATGVIKRKRKTFNPENLVLAGQSSHTKVEN